MLLHTFDKDCNMSLSQFSAGISKTWRADLNRFPQILLVGKNEGWVSFLQHETTCYETGCNLWWNRLSGRTGDNFCCIIFFKCCILSEFKIFKSSFNCCHVVLTWPMFFNVQKFAFCMFCFHGNNCFDCLVCYLSVCFTIVSVSIF